MPAFARAVSMGYGQGAEMNGKYGSGNCGWELLFQETWRGRFPPFPPCFSGKEEKIRLDGDLMVKQELGKCTRSFGRSPVAYCVQRTCRYTRPISNGREGNSWGAVRWNPPLSPLGHASHGLLPADGCGWQDTKAGLFPRHSRQLNGDSGSRTTNSMALLNFVRSELQKTLFTTGICPKTFSGLVARCLLLGGPGAEQPWARLKDKSRGGRRRALHLPSSRLQMPFQTF